MSLPPSPDLAAWRDAQDRLRLALGQDIDFQIPVAPTWDPAVQLDPETGLPYDPTIVPTSGGDFTTVTVRVSVVFRPLHRGQVEDLVISDDQAGVMNTESVALIVGDGDQVTIADATGFTLNGKDYRITDIIPDGLGGIERYLVYGQAR